MPTLNLGKVRPAIKGAWNSATSTYETLDQVEHNGSSYVALVDPPVNSNPETQTSIWQLVSAKGDAGPAGSQGSAGAAGSDGADGSQGVQGDQGIQGVQGVQGPDGPQGAQGPQGVNGVDGTNGTDGADGVDGISGASGGGADLVFWENDTNVTTDYTITSGKNAMSAGPITVDTGVTVTVPVGSTWSIV